MDGVSGQQITRQKWLAEADDGDDEVAKQNFFDGAVFMISFVPIQLMTDNNIISKIFINFCRPIKFEFIKENNVNTINEDFRFR